MAARADVWPELTAARLWPTMETLQLWAQIVGKTRLSQTPWLNHGWHVTLRVSARGLTTGLIPHGAVGFSMEFDFIAGALATDPEAAAEITLQPIRRFGFDGAILFSDILMVPWALGQDLWFEAGEGPRLAPKLTTHAAIDALGVADTAKLQPIYDTCTRVTAALPPEVTFLGFAGSPWTVATYMIAGQGSKDQAEARTLAYADRGAMEALVDAIVNLTVDYLANQIASGVEAVQLFDSWAGSLSPTQYEDWVIAPNARIVERLHERCPGTPVIGFPKGSGAKLVDYVAGVRPDAVGLDETVDPAWANAVLPTGLPVQGNLDPIALFAGGAALDAGIDRILDAFTDRPHIFNLGHGIGQFTPIEHVQQLIDRVRSPR